MYSKMEEERGQKIASALSVLFILPSSEVYIFSRLKSSLKYSLAKDYVDAGLFANFSSGPL